MLPFTFAGLAVTPRLRLRLLEPRDLDDIHSYQGRADVCEYLPYEPRTRDEVSTRIAERSAAATLAADGDYLQLAVESPATMDAPARVIGELYLFLKSGGNLGGAIGWVFHPDVQGRGFATEAATAVLDIAFEKAGLHRVIAELDPRNAASVALCRRLGMREEAHFRSDYREGDGWADSGVYAILAEEWAARDQP